MDVSQMSQMTAPSFILSPVSLVEFAACELTLDVMLLQSLALGSANARNTEGTAQHRT